jgi:hypothetical protein
MKRIVNRLMNGLALLGLAWPACAVTSDDGVNPYLVVVERNAFDLKPIAPPPDPNIPPPQPPTKISLQGITVLFGKKQVLLKIPEPPEPGKPAAAKERSLIMEEGERRGVLEVVKIDPDAREVEFKDSGNSVKLKLADFVAKTPAAPPGAVPPPGIPMVPGIPRPGMPTAFPNLPPMPQPTPAAASPVPTSGVSTPGQVTYPTRTLRTTPSIGMPVTANAPSPAPPQLTPEEQIILMEVERERNKNNPNYPPLPPTELTPR